MSEYTPAGRRSAPLRYFGGLVSVMNAVGSCWIMILMIMINMEVIGRAAFNAPIIGIIEMIEISIIGIVFLQLADSLRRGVLTRSDGLANRLLQSHPAIGHSMALVTFLFGAIFMLMILWGYIPNLIDAWQKDYYVGVDGLFTAPVWPISLVVAISITVTMCQFLVMLGDEVRSFARLGRG